jgi:glycosyltransferase involved in cell wall biosynthesis
MPVADIAAAIITRNAGPTLAAALDSLRSLPEVVIYDNGSTDDTLEVAGRYENVRLFTGEFMGFGKTFNHAADLATRDWVFTIDADEAISDALLRSIDAADLSDPQLAYEVLRDTYRMGRHVKHAGWARDWLLRLYNRQVFRHSEDDVHPRIYVPEGARVQRLDGPLIHNAVQELSQFLDKTNHYTELRRISTNKTFPPLVIFLRAFWAFLKAYFFQGGFLDGWRGLVIAVSNFNGTFFKYMKIYADKATGREASGA